MNRVILMGRLTRDPEVRYTPTQKVVCQFTLAVDRPYTNQEGQREADFIPVVVWGRTAELCGNSLAKGHRLLVEGRMQVRSYDGKDGVRRWVTEVIANNIEFVERRSSAPHANVAGGQQAPGASAGYAGGYGGASAAPSAPQTSGQADTGSGMEGLGAAVPFDEDVPF